MTKFNSAVGIERLRAPGKIDAAIVVATRQLMADSERGVLTPRETLGAALDINQFKPQRAIWSGPPDTARVLDAFDRLSDEGEPVVLKRNRSNYMGVTSGTPAGVTINEARGMGGLPDAAIKFSAFEASRNRGESAAMRGRSNRRGLGKCRSRAVVDVGAPMIMAIRCMPDELTLRRKKENGPPSRLRAGLDFSLASHFRWARCPQSSVRRSFSCTTITLG